MSFKDEFNPEGKYFFVISNRFLIKLIENFIFQLLTKLKARPIKS